MGEILCLAVHHLCITNDLSELQYADFFFLVAIIENSKLYMPVVFCSGQGCFLLVCRHNGDSAFGVFLDGCVLFILLEGFFPLRFYRSYKYVCAVLYFY